MGRIFSSFKDFGKGLLRHWIWTLVFLMFLAPILIGVLGPVTAKVKSLLPFGKKAAV